MDEDNYVAEERERLIAQLEEELIQALDASTRLLPSEEKARIGKQVREALQDDAVSRVR